MFNLQFLQIRERVMMLDFLCDVDRFDGHLLGMPISDFLDEIPRLPNVSFDLERLFRHLPPETMDLPVFELLEALRFDARKMQDIWARERHERAETDRHLREEDERRRERRSEREEPQVPGWLKFISEVAKNMHESSQKELNAECKAQYEDGFEAARRGWACRAQLFGEDPRFFRAWSAGYDAGS